MTKAPTRGSSARHAARAPLAMLAAALALPGHAQDRPAGAVAPAAPTASSAPGGASAPVADGTRLQITEPFVELHTGPGRGFPVFFVAEKGAWITIELRKTDWYRVATPGPQGGQVGWVHRSQLASTVTEAGGTTSFRDLVVDDYLARRLELGAGWGQFEAEPMLKLWGTWRMAETLSLEGTIGQVQGAFSGTDFWHLGLVSEPWADLRLSPYFSVGLGRFRNIPNTSLVGALETDTNLGFVSLGARWYIAERFVARLDWSLYTAFVSDTRSPEYQALTLGLSFTF
jgi:hypothetical protein